MTDLFGLCPICGRSGPMFTCQLCGRLVCERCFDHRHLICPECSHQKKRSGSPSFPLE